MENILIALALALVAGLLTSRIAKKLKLPAVTAYLITGILVGPNVLGALGIDGLGFNTFEQIEALEILTEMALGFIAFEIGNEFRFKTLKLTGKATVVIGIVQAFATAIVVDIVLVIVHLLMPDVLSLEAAIILGAISTATAPAATLMVVKQYKAKGKMTDMLLQVVALDDAVGLVIFAVSFGIAKALASGTISVAAIVLAPLFEIVASLVIGAALGFLLTWLIKFFKSRSKRTGLVVAVVMLAVGIAQLEWHVGGVELAFSNLLMLMMLGTVFCNTCKASEYIMGMAERWTGPLMILFFVISGAELRFEVFANIWFVLVGVAYLIARSAAKIFSSNATAKLMGCEKKIYNNIGITLLPQAGVALGMISMVSSYFGSSSDIAIIVTQVILMSVLVYELVGPLLTRQALERCGDITSLQQGEEPLIMNGEPITAETYDGKDDGKRRRAHAEEEFGSNDETPAEFK